MPDIDFDLAGARKAGAKPAELSNYFKNKFNLDFDFENAYKAGASDNDVLSFLNKSYSDLKKKGVSGTESGPIPSKLPSREYLSQGEKMAQRGFAVAPNTIQEGFAKDAPKQDESTLAGLYNTVVDRIGSLVGGIASSEAMNPAAKLIKGITTKFEETATGKPAISKEGKVAPMQTKIDEKKWRESASGLIEKARSAKSSKEFEKRSSQFDVFDGGISMDDIKGMAFQAPAQIADMAMGALTGGGSFLAQSWNDNAKDLEENPNAAKLTDNQKFGYLFTQSLAQAALEKLSLDKITKNTGLTKKVQQKIASEVIDEFVQKGVKATGEEIEKAVIRKASGLVNKIKNVGIKAATGFITEGGTEGIQQGASDAIKLITNKISKNEIFDEQDIKDNFLKNAVNASVLGGVMGGTISGSIAGISNMSNTNKAIRKQISEMQTPEELQGLQTQINEQVELGNITPQEAQAVNIKAQEYAQIAAKIPSDIDTEKKYLIIGGIEQRNGLKSDIDKLNTEMKSLDESLQKDKKAQVELLQAKLDQVDDHINTIVSGESPEYKEKDGNYLKITDGEEVKISKPYYELAKAAEQENERKESQYIKELDEYDAIDAMTPEESKNLADLSAQGKSEEASKMLAAKLEEIKKPEVKPTEDINKANVTIEGTTDGYKVISGDKAGSIGDIRQEANEARKKGQDAFTKETVKDGKRIFTLTDTTVSDNFGRPGFKSASISFPEGTKVTMEDVMYKLKSELGVKEIKPTEVKEEPKIEEKGLAMKGIKAAETRKTNEEARKIEPTDARSAVLKYLSGANISRKSIDELYGRKGISLNVEQRKLKSEEVKARDYVAKEGEGETIDKAAHNIWDNLSEEMQGKMDTQTIKEELEKAISEYKSKTEAAKSLVEGYKEENIEDMERKYYEKYGDNAEAEINKELNEVPKNQLDIEQELINANYESEQQFQDDYWSTQESTNNFTEKAPSAKIEKAAAPSKETLAEAYKDLVRIEKRKIINSKFDELIKELKIEKICP